MATVGIVNGHYLRFYNGGSPIARAVSCTLSFSAETLDFSTKDSASGGPAGWREVAPGQKSASGSTEGLFAEDANAVSVLYSAFANGTELSLTFTTGESGDSIWSGTAIVTSLEINAANNENVTYSCSFEFTGEVTLS